MAEQVHLHPKLEKQLTALESRGNTPAIAAGRARKIIEAMIKGQTSQASGLFRARSDGRVKNSWKYDLGAGYRLLCIRSKQIIYIMHAGDHESCETWFNNNLKKQPQNTTIKMTAFTIRNTAQSFDFQTVRSPEQEPDFDDQDLPPIPQEYLRKVFCGLTG